MANEIHNIDLPYHYIFKEVLWKEIIQ
jgi:hypothetical protein